MTVTSVHTDSLPVGWIPRRQVAARYLCDEVSPEERAVDQSDDARRPVKLGFLSHITASQSLNSTPCTYTTYLARSCQCPDNDDKLPQTLID